VGSYLMPGAGRLSGSSAVTGSESEKPQRRERRPRQRGRSSSALAMAAMVALPVWVDEAGSLLDRGLPVMGWGGEAKAKACVSVVAGHFTQRHD